MPRASVALLVALLVGLVTRPAEACDCGTGPPEPLEALRVSAAVFEGRAIASTPGGTEFLVERAWKGTTAGSRIVVASDGSSCGYHFLPGDHALVFAPRNAGGLRIAQCDPALPSRVTMGPAVAREAAGLGPATSARPPAANTCSCAGVTLTPTGDLERFEATGVSTRTNGGRRWIEVKRTSRARPGEPRTWTLVTQADACGVDVLPGARVRVSGLRTGGQYLTVGACAAGTRVERRRDRRQLGH